MKRIAAAIFFLAAGSLSASAVEAGSTAPQRFGRASSVAPDARKPRANPAAVDAAGDPVAVSEGFELVDVYGGGLFANGWTRQNNSDMPDLHWVQCVPVGQGGVWNAADGADGSCTLSSFASTQQDGGTISNWIVTPLVNFAPDASVSFQTRTKPGSLFPDRLQVRACNSGPCTNLGTSAEDVGDFTTLLLDINPGEVQSGFPEDWSFYSLGFADGLPTSGSGRIAFRYYVHDSGQNGTRGNLIGLDRVVVSAGQGGASPLEFTATVAPADAANPDACGTSTSLDVTVGDQVDYCYKVTNHSSATLNYQFLRDDRSGPILTQQPVTLAPGQSHQYNRVVTIGESQTPSVTWTAQAGPWGYTYAVSPPPADFIDISDGTLLDVGVTGTSAILPFPADFDFRFYGHSIDRYCVGLPGLFQSVKRSCSAAAFYGRLPADSFIGAPTMAPLWMNVDYSGGGSLYQKTLGSPPNRQFIVEWKDIPTLFDGTMTMEVILNESSDTFEFRYAADYGGTSQPFATGLQSLWLANVYPDNGSLDNVGSIVWTPADPTAYTATRKLTINAAVPELAASAEAVDATAPSHGTTTATLTIGNSGGGRLDWSMRSASAMRGPAVAPVVAPVGDPGLTSFGRPRGDVASARSVAPRPSSGGGLTDVLQAYAVDLSEGPYLWHFDPNAVNGDGRQIAGYLPANSLITAATFLDDDFDTLYVFDAANNQLLALDVTRPYAGIRLVGTADLPINATTGMKQDPSSGAVYLSTADGQSSALWTIDPATAAVRPVGSTSDAPGIIDIAFDAQGDLYGVDIVLDALVSIDKTTGAAQPIGSLGFDANCAAGLAFDYASGTLYFSSLTSCIPGSAGWWSIDLVTGQATQISPIDGIDGNAATWDAVAIAQPAGDACIDPAEVPWLSLSPAGGSVRAGESAATIDLAFDASALADGTYSADLCLYSNDPLQRHRRLPVTFRVGIGADRIFADGFDGGAP